MKHNVIFVDHNNDKQVRWWNKIGRKLVTTEYRQTMFDTKTYMPSTTRLHITGMMADYVAKRNASFNRD